MALTPFSQLYSKQSLLNSRRIGTEKGPSPRIFDANIVIIIPLKLEHTEGI